jgi:hypothetical protein
MQFFHYYSCSSNGFEISVKFCVFWYLFYCLKKEFLGQISTSIIIF